MPDWFYAVRLSGSEEIARAFPRYVAEFLVQLVCEEHLRPNFHEGNREASACEVAMKACKSQYGSDWAQGIRYTKASRGDLPVNLGDADFSAPCGCRVWVRIGF